MTAAMRMALPVAESQLSVKTAWSRPETTIFGAEMPFKKFFTPGNPHTKTKALRIAQGSRALAVGMDEADEADGLRKRRNDTSATIEHAAATTSTSHGPW